MSEITDAMLHGLYQNSEGQDIDVIADIEQLYTDELDLIQRPSVIKRIGVTAAGIVATAIYYNNRNRELAIKGLYALFAAGVGINIGMAGGDSRMGAQESRIEQGPLAPEPARGGDTKVSLTMSGRLSSSLGGEQQPNQGQR